MPVRIVKPPISGSNQNVHPDLVTTIGIAASFDATRLLPLVLLRRKANVHKRNQQRGFRLLSGFVFAVRISERCTHWYFCCNLRPFKIQKTFKKGHPEIQNFAYAYRMSDFGVHGYRDAIVLWMIRCTRKSFVDTSSNGSLVEIRRPASEKPGAGR